MGKEILMHFRATRRSRRDVSLHDPIGVDRDGNEITLIDVLQANNADMDDLVAQRIFIRRLLESVDRLSPRERRVLELRFGLNGTRRRTQREVARELGISRSYVSRIEKRAVKRLCRLLIEGAGRERPEGEAPPGDREG